VTAANHNTQTDPLYIAIMEGIWGLPEKRPAAEAALARLQHQHEQAMAVVEAARAAERKLWHEYRKGFDQGYCFPKVPDDESWAEGEALAAALARLDEQEQP
jgi:hypothetical protein